MKNKKAKWLIVAVAVFILVFFLLPLIMFSNTTVVCAKYDRISRIKTSKILVYKFNFNGADYESNFSIAGMTKQEIDELKKAKCIEIEVSNYWAFYNRRIED